MDIDLESVSIYGYGKYGSDYVSRTLCFFKNYHTNNASPNTVYWDVEVYNAVEKTTYSKGTTQYSDVTANSSLTYPSNGKSGSYWYVYKGVQ